MLVGQNARRAPSAPAGRVHPPLPGLPALHQPKAKRLIYLHMNGGPVPARPLGLQAAAAGALRQGPARLASAAASGITTMTSGQARLPGRAVEVQVRPARQVRHAGSASCCRTPPKIVDDIAAGQDGPHQRDQPRPGLHVRDDRQRDARQAEHRLVARLRPRQREQRPAGVRRAHAALFLDGGNGQALFTRMWASGFLPTQVHRRRAPQRRRPGAVPAEPAGVDARRPPRHARRARTSSTSAASSSSATRRRRRASPSTRWPSACRRSVPGTDRPLAASRSATLDLYGPDVKKPGTFAAQRPARPPAGRARRARRADPAPRLGPARQPADGSSATSARTPTRPTAALVTDLKQRGLLDDTLVVWGGEFGRTVY